MHGAIYPFDTCKEIYDHEMRIYGMKESIGDDKLSIASLCNLNDLATPPKYHEKRFIAQGRA
jgi:hypothetical protein